MPIIDHRHAPEVPWRPGYRKWDIAGHEQGVNSTLSINTAEPGTGAPLHTHTIDELIVIVAVLAVDDMLKSLVRKIEQIPPARRTHTSLNA